VQEDHGCTIEAKIPMNWYTYGGRVTCLVSGDPASMDVKISGRIGGSPIDFGRCRRLVIGLLDETQRTLAA
jgi:hypothetical protein